MSKKVVDTKYMGTTTVRGKEVFVYYSLADSPDQVKLKERSYAKFDRIVKVQIKEIKE